MNEAKWEVDLIGMKDGHASAVLVKMSKDLKFNCGRITNYMR